MQTFAMNIKNRFWVHFDPLLFFDILCKTDLIISFDLLIFFTEFFVIFIWEGSVQTGGNLLKYPLSHTLLPDDIAPDWPVLTSVCV